MLIDKNVLEERLKSICDNAAWQWFSGKIAGLNNKQDELDSLDITMAMARRKMGTKALFDKPSPDTRSQTPGGMWLGGQWQVSDAARVLILLCAKEHHSISVIERAYQQGDEHEKEAVLKGLCLLDSEGELVAMAVDACRTNILSMLESLAMENTYPEKFFSDHEFNQMVLKCLFLGFNIERVVGLHNRSNFSMSRMCYDYLCERRAAGRDFPTSIWLSININDIAEAKETFTQYMASENEQHRYYVARSLCQQVLADKEFSDTVNSKIEQDESERIRQLIGIKANNNRA